MYRNNVKFEICKRKKNFYAEETKSLPKNDSKGWWDIVNKLSGRTTKKTNLCLQSDGKTLSDRELLTALNIYFTAVNADIPTLDLTCLAAYLPLTDVLPILKPYQVCEKLLKLNSFKACGPDNIPPQILKEFVYILSEPVATTFNDSLSSGLVPSLWKDSYITPIGKIPQPVSECDIRPISLNAVFVKSFGRLCRIMVD